MPDFDFPQPLRLAVGSHRQGSGRGCAMNVISWENGDARITDHPDCADPALTKIVQKVNDGYCQHLDAPDNGPVRYLLCPACSFKVLELAHRTPGTFMRMPLGDRRELYFTILERLVKGYTASPIVEEAFDSTWRYIRGQAFRRQLLMWFPEPGLTAVHDVWLAARIADFGLNTGFAATGPISISEQTAILFEASLVVVPGFVDPGLRTVMLEAAHRVIDIFEEITGVRAEPVDPEAVVAAVCNMQTRDEGAHA
jgi:hypothetical protein